MIRCEADHINMSNEPSERVFAPSSNRIRTDDHNEDFGVLEKYMIK